MKKSLQLDEAADRVIAARAELELAEENLVRVMEATRRHLMQVARRDIEIALIANGRIR